MSELILLNINPFLDSGFTQPVNNIGVLSLGKTAGLSFNPSTAAMSHSERTKALQSFCEMMSGAAVLILEVLQLVPAKVDIEQLQPNEYTAKTDTASGLWNQSQFDLQGAQS